MNVPNCSTFVASQQSIALTISNIHCSGGRPSVRGSPRKHIAARGVFRLAGRQEGGGEVGVPAGLHLVPEGTCGSVIPWRGEREVEGSCRYLQTVERDYFSFSCSEGRLFVCEMRSLL